MSDTWFAIQLQIMRIFIQKIRRKPQKGKSRSQSQKVNFSFNGVILMFSFSFCHFVREEIGAWGKRSQEIGYIFTIVKCIWNNTL